MCLYFIFYRIRNRFIRVNEVFSRFLFLLILFCIVLWLTEVTNSALSFDHLDCECFALLVKNEMSWAVVIIQLDCCASFARPQPEKFLFGTRTPAIINERYPLRIFGRKFIRQLTDFEALLFPVEQNVNQRRVNVDNEWFKYGSFILFEFTIFMQIFLQIREETRFESISKRLMEHAYNCRPLRVNGRLGRIQISGIRIFIMQRTAIVFQQSTVSQLWTFSCFLRNAIVADLRNNQQFIVGSKSLIQPNVIPSSACDQINESAANSFLYWRELIYGNILIRHRLADSKNCRVVPNAMLKRLCFS